MKTEVKTTDSDLFFVIPKTFLKFLKWKKDDVINVELLDGKLLISKI